MNKKVNGEYAFIFHGLSTEYKKKLSSMCAEHKDVLRGYCNIAETEIGFDTWEYLMNDIKQGFTDCLADQVAIYTLNCAIYNIYLNSGYCPKILLGYSLGLISALTCSKAVDFKDGLKLVLKGHELPMKSMGEVEGAMAVIIGLSADTIRDIIDKTGSESLVDIAIENTRHCFVVSGVCENVKKVMEYAVSDGALKVINLSVPIPYHSRVIHKGAEEFCSYAKNLHMEYPDIPILSAVTQNVINSPEKIRNEIYENIRFKISLADSIKKLEEAGIKKIIEVGLGNSYSRLFSCEYSGMEFINYSDLIGGLNGG